jgi:hypothetical protein
MSRDETCFVIMPFAESYSATYRQAIRPAVEEAAQRLGLPLRCVRGDEAAGPGSITRQIVEGIHAARVVIADLSGDNPNVFYELGIAHSAGNKTVRIARDVQKIPFDVHAYRVIPYAPDEAGLARLRAELVPAIAAACACPTAATNPVYDFAPICHSRLIASVHEVVEIERAVKARVWLIVPNNDTDNRFFGETVKHNLGRCVAYRYLLPRTRRALRGWEMLLEMLALDDRGRACLHMRTVPESMIESEVVVYDAYTPGERVFLMSPLEEAVPYFYHVRGSKADAIKHRLEDLWEMGEAP